MPDAGAERSPLSAAAATDTGLRRENNEDRYLCDPGRGLFIVIDGVGGQAAGERAAEAALRMLRTRLERETGTPHDRIREAITLANNEVLRLARSEPEWTGMACVLTVALVRDGRLVVGHVGDTRLYVFRNGRVQKATHDHSPIGEREDRGELGELDAMRHPRRNEIYRDVGSELHNPTDDRFIEIRDLPFDDDSAILLCSDGLSDLVRSDAVADIVYRQSEDPERVVRSLIQAANEAGGKDNITAVFAAGSLFADPARRQRGVGHEPSPPVDEWEAAADGRQNRPWLRRVHLPGSGATIAALAIGCALGVGLAYLALTHIDGVSEWALDASRPRAWSRTWDVGFEAGAEFATIGEALACARPGDTIRVGPGEYRAPLTLRAGITIVSATRHEAIIRPAFGAPPSAAVRVPAGADGRLVGFRISGDADHPLGVGVRIGRNHAQIDDVEVSGALQAGIVVEQGSWAVVRASYVHDNLGPGIVVHGSAAPQLLHNVITANGRGGGQGGAAIELGDAANALLFGNIVVGNGEDQVAGLPASRRGEIARDNIVGLPPVAPKRPAGQLR
jgi:serine/threonine protein phosphatase PrpC